ncbi:MAG: bifunctional alpha/beta hydrolase/class I SAM-dependent methyltransferase [Alphaproteobacteria bacterium]|jgi:alpha-beta hydrolase superfamily lysophospholipase|nr:bifunctional alpha/beta hydrolase/class I SAM-dependent methyltransferase [Alphaproteobacteria bacterium]
MRVSTEHHFATHDGARLFYRHWPAEVDPARGAVVLLHRGHEHSGRMAHLADELRLPAFDVFAWDARGHGRSEVGADETSLAAMVRDLDCFVEHVRHVHGIEAGRLAVVAQSVGAVLAAAWVHDYAPKLRCLVLASPAFRVRFYVPFARAGLGLVQRLFGDFRLNSYVKPRQLTHDEARIASYAEDPLIRRPIWVRLLLALYETGSRIVADAAAITVPTQLLISGDDWVVARKPQDDFFEGLGAEVKERHVFDGFRHDTLGEANRAVALEKLRAFVTARFDSPPAQREWGDADLRGPTVEEAAALARPLASISAAGLYWGTMRLLLRLAGRVSGGIRLGHDSGFDSGASLDYVYANRPTGLTAIGRGIDKAYLQAIGWRGIRQRKAHLEELLGRASERLVQEGRPLRVLDVAAGHGRYVLDALPGDARRPESILLRDLCSSNVAAGNKLVAERGCRDIARFEQGDAFDGEALATLTPKPTLAIVSGLYELFPENAPVRRSLDGLARALPAGGYLVYTGQPWHPQLEFIARTLSSHRNGAPWIMRRRTQAELDQLVERAGFAKVEQRIDAWGIFTVSLARRVER